MPENNSYIWAKNLGGSGDDVGYDITVDSAGNVYTIGFFNGTVDFDPSAGIFNLTAARANEKFITKFDSNGNFVWAKPLIGDTDDTNGLSSIRVDNLGYIYTTGRFLGTIDFDPGAGVFNLAATPGGQEDSFISKLDSNGNFVWAKQLGGTLGDFVYDITVDSLGNVYTTGNFEGTADFDPGVGVFNLTSAGLGDIFISKLDSNGNFVWARQQGGIDNDLSTRIVLDSLGNIYTTGSFTGIGVDFDPGLGNSNTNSLGNPDVFVSKLDSNGNFIWVKTLGGTNNDSSTGLVLDSLDNVYTVGIFQGTGDFDPGAGVTGFTSFAGSNDIFISKLDSSGNFVWAKQQGGIGDDVPFDIALDSLGNVYNTGRFPGTADFDPGVGVFNLTSAGQGDIFISKLDSNGNFVWARQQGGTADDSPRSITVDNLGNVYTTGWFNGVADFDSSAGTVNLTSNGGVDIFISKLGIIPFEPTNAGLTGTTSSDGVWGDYNKDGALDALVAGFNAPTKVYQNSPGSFTAVATLPEVSSGGIAWGDYNNDGNLDIALAGYDQLTIGTAQIYRNDGGIFNNIGAGLLNFYHSDLAWGDYDNDGDIDLLINGNDYLTNIPTTKLYRNDGANTFVDSGILLIGLQNGSVAWGDYDNDRDLDILITGEDLLAPYSKVYRNDGGIFTDINAALPGVYHGDAAWGDYDNDGDLDIALTGIDSLTNLVTQVYTNTNGVFSPAASLIGLGDSSVAWGDYDNNGNLDLVVTGSDQSIVYRNEGANVFTKIAAGLVGVSQGSAHWGDANNDRKLDILLTGNNIGTPFADIYQNNTLIPNTLPTPPSSLNIPIITANTVNFSWNPATDIETPVTGLTYNLQVGTTPGGSEIVSAMPSLPQMGNVNHNLNWTLNNLPYGTYYWTVQAVDTAFGRSTFAPEATLIVPPPTYNFGSINYTTPEGNIRAIPPTVEIIRTGDITVAENVTVTAISGTATPGTDYTTGPFTVSFAANQTNAFVPIEILGDIGFEPDETLNLQITGFSGLGVVGTQGNTTLTLANDDISGVGITQTGSSSDITEGGLSDTYNIVLNSIPTAPVTITITPSNAEVNLGAGAGVPLNLNFTADATALTPQTVTVTAVDDFIAEGIHNSILAHSALSSDPNYNGILVPFTVDGIVASTVTVNITDNDIPGITINPTSGLSTTEVGGTANFNLSLKSQPTADVTLTLNSSNPKEGSLSTSKITFNSTNWNLPQTVIITGVDDNIVDGNIPYSIITDPVISLDPKYNNLNPDDITVTNTDNDIPGITINPTSGLSTTEVGGTANFNLSLKSQPTTDVTLTLNSSNPKEGSLSTSKITFNSTNWNLPQTVVITGVDDNIVDGNIPYTIITDPVISLDPKYNNLNPDDITVTNTDNDIPGITINPTSGLSTTEVGGTANFNLSLKSQPTADVTLTLNSSNPKEGSLSTSKITFNSTNWNLPQTVIITGVDDNIVDGNIPYSIITDPVISLDPKYNNLNPDDITVTNSDNDIPIINLSIDTVTATESEATIVTLTATVAAGVTQNQTLDINITGTGITPNDYILSNPQIVINQDTNIGTVTLKINDDKEVEGDEIANIKILNPSSGLILGTTTAANLTIVDNDIPLTYNFSAANYTIPEGNSSNSSQVITLNRTGNINLPETVTLSIIGGTATQGDDYLINSLTVNFAAGQTQAILPVEILGDTTLELDETIELQLSSFSAGGTAGNPSTTTLTLQNDDNSPATVNFSQSQYQTNENGTIIGNQITLNRTGNLSQFSSVEVQLNTGTAIAGEDFIATPIVVNFAANETSKTLTIPINDDNVAENPENLTLTLVNPNTGTLLGTQTTANLEIIDNDQTGITINPTQISATEAGVTGNYTLVLNSIPTEPVTINFNLDNQINPITPLTFDQNNWNTPQTVTITATDDNLVEGNHQSLIRHTLQTNDVQYSNVLIPDVTVNITDNDSAGISISPLLITATEGGATGIFQILLTTVPTADVTLTFKSNTQLQPLPDITFNSNNWNIPQTVTVTATDDNLLESLHQAIITSTVSSSDITYNGLKTNPVTVEITDNDSAGVSINPNNLDIIEGKKTETYNIFLTTQPTAPVTIQFNSGDPLKPITEITFNPDNWNQPQTVTVEAIDDTEFQNNRTASITHTAISSDKNYNGINISSVAVEITDNDPPPTILISSPTLGVTEGGNSNTYQISLTAKPTAPVTIDFETGDPLQPISAITFDVNNWNTPQTVTVTAVDDNITESEFTTPIRHRITTTDPQYAKVTLPDVVTRITDNDTASVKITQTDNRTDVSEDGLTDTYSVVLNSKPTADVTVTITPDSQTDLGNGEDEPKKLTFTSENWNKPQTVTVKAVDDQDIEDTIHTSTLVHTVNSSDTNYQNQVPILIDGVSSTLLTVNITENDAPLPPGTAGINILQPLRTTELWEGFGSANYKVVLTSEPIANVEVNLSTDPQLNVNQTVLFFTPENWNIPQTVTVNAIDNTLDERQHTSIITHQTISTDSRYQGLSAVNEIVIHDNDNVGEIINLIEPDAIGVGNKDDRVTGSVFDDVIYGRDGNDDLSGKGGNDVILGQNNVDLLLGDEGNDVLLGGRENDFIFGGIGDDILFGGLGDDRLYGEEGNDQLFGGFGNDRLDGGVGTDILTGFSGNDVFVINQETASDDLNQVDIIKDFTLTQDIIELSPNLTFEQLNIIQGTGIFINYTLVQLKSNGQYLAIIQNITATDLDSSDFI
ncbi:conserved hypothetical protein [Planktothrix sp. PCC 11201]|uniref:Calx-beta domain-containing protein n=1 Tax=Planktothrix sp. PCC 11201 TaxID=1729650 RepID=UPI000915A4AF|nr:Calx-beta domain-containing protein [Planktothrix sp. PCC 11201]SKB12493.1 conserved hypothetical protein [Planktothrix sp. PCC 11201]